MEPGEVADQGWETATGEIAEPAVEGRGLGSSPNSSSRQGGMAANDADAHYNFGLMLMQAHGDVTGAEMMYRRCLTLDPKHTSASYNLANLLYTVKGDFLGAEIMYRRCIDLNPTHLSAICNYGTLLKDQLDDLEGAILLYGLANKLDPQDSTVLGNCHSARAKEAERRGEFAESAHLYREAVAAWQGAWLPEDDPDVVECNARALELEAWAAEAEADRLSAAEVEEEVEAAAGVKGKSGGGGPKSPSHTEGSMVDDVIAARSKPGGGSSSTAKAILKSLKGTSLSRFLRSTRSSPKAKAANTATATSPQSSSSASSSSPETPVQPPPAPPQSLFSGGNSGDESNSGDVFELAEDEAFKLAPASPSTSSTPLFGGGMGAAAAAAAVLASASASAADSTTLTNASGESALDALALSFDEGGGGGAASSSSSSSAGGGGQQGEEDEEEDDDEEEFAGASLLDEHAIATEALEAPRRLVTAANSLVAKRKYSEALTHYYDALDVFEQLKAESVGREGLQRDLMRDMAKTLNNLAAVLHQLRKFDEAIEVYGRALEIKRSSDGVHHFSVGHTLYNMACLHMDHGKLAKAADLMQQSLEIYELAFGAGHQLTVDVEQQLLGLLHELKMEGRQAQAQEEGGEEEEEEEPELAEAELAEGVEHTTARSPTDAKGRTSPNSPTSPTGSPSKKQGNRPRPAVPARKNSLKLSHVRISRTSMPDLGSRI